MQLEYPIGAYVPILVYFEILLCVFHIPRKVWRPRVFTTRDLAGSHY